MRCWWGLDRTSRNITFNINIVMLCLTGRSFQHCFLFHIVGFIINIDPFHPPGLFLYPLKNQRFSDVFRGQRKRAAEWNGLITVTFAKILALWLHHLPYACILTWSCQYQSEITAKYGKHCQLSVLTLSILAKHIWT